MRFFQILNICELGLFFFFEDMSHYVAHASLEISI
jgi:hypothetical protein